MSQPQAQTASDLPTGTVTFVFSDIEGSTRLVQALGADYPPVLTASRDLIAGAVAAHAGSIFGYEGDAVFMAFGSPAAAVHAAVEAQRAIAAHPWPAGRPLRVRMGIHTGEALLVGNDYVGLALHAAARIASAANGGQILLSEATRSLLQPNALPPLSLRDMGSHRLKDLTEAERLWQVDDPERKGDFPPLRTLEARPNNLPVQLTSFVGRQELAEARRLLGRARLLTLTGPGGTGKTRLALQLAADVLDGFPDGVYWVALDAITEPELIPGAILAAIPLDPGASPPLERLSTWLHDRTTLIVLDNFEQVVDGAAIVGGLLRESPASRIVVTSRIPLHAYGEQELPVQSLGLPEPGSFGLEEVARSEAVQLFVERAMGADPSFTLTAAIAPTIAAIVRQLDGLPLAVELAAARTRIFPPEALLARLGRSLSMLVGGPRDRPTRQQTLRGAIDWSYDLLEEPDRRLFARFGVFAGGAFLAQAEAVCGPDIELGQEVLDGLTSLADKSLLRGMPVSVRPEPRFAMLVTIRDYALERLETSGEAETLYRRHAEAYLALAEAAAPQLTAKDSRARLDALATDHDNLRAALDWAEAHDEAELALALCGAAWRFWQIRGHIVEARARLARVLALPGTAKASPAARARAEGAAGSLAYWQGDAEGVVSHYTAAVEQARASGDAALLAEGLYNLSFTYLPFGIDSRTDLVRARALLDEALGLYDQLDDDRGRANVHWALSTAESYAHDYEAGLVHGLEALARNQAIGDSFGTGWSLHMVGFAELGLQMLDQAEQHFHAALEVFRDTDDRSAVVMLLADLSSLARFRGDMKRGWRLIGASDRLRAQTGADLVLNSSPFDWSLPARPDDDPDALAVWQEGHDMSLEKAIAYALEESPNQVERGQDRRS